MDFPKSVPGVGLVGGQFADENPGIGQQGSLIPAAWGNAVTQELLNIIRAAGGEPDEEVLDQLSVLLLRSPTEDLRGMPRKSSVTQAKALTDDETMLTPAMLAQALSIRVGHTYTANDWFPMPGGWILQTQTVNSTASPQTLAFNFPIAFPTAHLCTVLCERDPVGDITNSATWTPNSRFQWNLHNWSGGPNAHSAIHIGF